MRRRAGLPVGSPGRGRRLQDSGSTQQTLANVGLIVGAVGVTAGVTMLVIGLSSDDGGTESASTQPSTSLAVGPGFTGLRGRF